MGRGAAADGRDGGGQDDETGGSRLGEVAEQNREQRLGFDREQFDGHPWDTDQRVMPPVPPIKNCTSRA